jgi:hypothetical protein
MKMSRELREQVFHVLYMEHLHLLPHQFPHGRYRVGLCLSLGAALPVESHRELCQGIHYEVTRCIEQAMHRTLDIYVTATFAKICFGGHLPNRERQEVMTALVPIRWMWFWNWVETGELPEPWQFFRDLVATPEGKELVNGLLNKLAYPRLA